MEPTNRLDGSSTIKMAGLHRCRYRSRPAKPMAPITGARHYEFPTTLVHGNLTIADALKILLDRMLLATLKHDLILLDDNQWVGPVDRPSCAKQDVLWEPLDVNLYVIDFFETEDVDGEKGTILGRRPQSVE